MCDVCEGCEGCEGVAGGCEGVLQECERVTINIHGIYRIYFGHLRTTVAAYKMWSQMIQYFMFVHRSLEEWEMG